MSQNSVPRELTMLSSNLSNSFQGTYSTPLIREVALMCGEGVGEGVGEGGSGRGREWEVGEGGSG